MPPPAFFLAVSGGGDNGAFGAGLINGWTTTGTRPQFRMVTGVSTGALIAPLAFLGPTYDPALHEICTTMSPDRVFVRRRLTAALFDDAMADSSPLADTVAHYADQRLFDAIADEYGKSRLLMIGTTDLDAQHPVIWNIGAIAASRHPKSLDLFRKILLASASIPGAFQPVLIDVEIDGRHFQEMHVDGGAIARSSSIPARSIPQSGPPGAARRPTPGLHRSRLQSAKGRPVRSGLHACAIRLGYGQAVAGRPWHKAPPGLHTNRDERQAVAAD